MQEEEDCCRVCSGDEDDSELILCDECNRGKYDPRSGPVAPTQTPTGVSLEPDASFACLQVCT